MTAPGPATRYLIADDDAVFRGRLARALRSRGIEVAEAGSTDEAASVARAFRPERAVIDLRLGEGSGLELLAELRAEHPRLESIVLTGYGSISTALEAVRRGARHYLTKPVDADDILHAFAIGVDGGDTALAGADPTHAPSLHRVEWEHIQRVLGDCGGNVSKAARALGLHRRTLQRKLATRPPVR
ncbi:MAG: response regulator [Myxococcota bacterium]